MTKTTEITNVARRSVLLGFAAGAFVLSARLSSPALAQEKKYGGDGMPGGLKDDPKLFLSIAEDGTVNLLCIRAEMGQGIRTSWGMVVADELEAELGRVKVLQAPGDQARFGNQDTDGSRSMRHHFEPLRRIAAAARMMLEQEAAARWGVPLTEVKAENNGIVHAGSGRRLDFGALAKGAAARPVPPSDALVLKGVSQFRYIGKDGVPLIDNLDITTGKALFGIDARVDGMAYAVVARPPVFGGKVKSFDAAKAMKVPGVLKVVAIEPPSPPVVFQPLGGVAVIAENTFAAIKGRAQLEIQWDDGPNASYDSVQYRKTLEAAAAKPGQVVRNDGDVDAALAGAAKRVSAEYYLPHLAQAPMEPPSATARVTPQACEVWCSVQNAEAIRTDLSKRFNVPIDKVTVNNLLLGGGFGRKSKPDFASEAAICSHAMGGRPVKLTFTREDDLQHSFFHTVSVERLEAGLDGNGKAVAWLHRTVAPTIAAIFEPGANHEMPLELAMGAVDNPFAIANFRVENPEAAAHTRVGWFRSVSNIPHAFAIQSFVAELAASLGRDPKDYLLELIGPARLIDASAPCRMPGSTARIPSATRSTPDGCAPWSRRRRARRAGDASCPRAADSASPRTAASSATPRSSPRWRSGPRASSRSRASTSPSIAAPWSIPTACARSSRGRSCRASAWRPWARSASRAVASSRRTSTATSSRVSTAHRRRSAPTW